MSTKRTFPRAGIILAVALLCAGWFGAKVFLGHETAKKAEPTLAAAEPQEAAADQQDNFVSVKTIRPRTDSNFQMTVEQPAFVKAYYQADLLSRVAGPIRFLSKDIGDKVKAGEPLVRIDVPDLVEDVLQREAVVHERKRELAVAEANVKMAAAQVESAKSSIKLKESEVLRADALRSFREKELERFQRLAKGPHPGVVLDVVDERTQYYEEAVAKAQAARAAVQKAQADLLDAEAKLEAAQADVKLKQALIDVSGKDRDRAEALLSFATLQAPFDGVIVRRNGDPGSFVQNATTGHVDPILTVARTDIVTIYMKVPDNYAPYVTRNIDAIIEMKTLPGMVIQGRVTRFAPSLETPEQDRTMRVEVDLFNGTPAEYQQLLGKAKETRNADFKGGIAPLLPTVNGKALGLDGRLLPGMFGKMKLVLRDFGAARLLPSTAIFSEGGRAYVFLARDGKVLKTQVDVQVDDGRKAKVVLLEEENGQVVRKGLTGDELIVASNQGELSDGQAVRAAEPSPWQMPTG